MTSLHMNTRTELLVMELLTWLRDHFMHHQFTSTFCPQIVFMCFFVDLRRAIISVIGIILLFIIQGQCVYRAVRT
jgi:hypothetical protein